MNRRILLVTAAVVLALVGTIAVYGYVKSADSRAVADTRAASVIVTTKRIPAGTSWADAVKGGYLNREHIPAGSAPSSAMASIAAAAIGRDAVAEADIAPGQIVLRQAFGTATPKTGVLSIPKHDVAVSVQVGGNSDVAGYVAPGSQVIIFMTAKYNGHKPGHKAMVGDELTMTRTVVPRAEVLATSSAPPTDVTGTSTTSSSSDSSTLVTVAVSQRDAERLILMQQVGQLYLGLLSANSDVSGDGGVVNLGDFSPILNWVGRS